MGPWGSGKTSLLNLVREELASNQPELPAIDFNPWMFSGAEQLIEVFFVELAAQLRIKKGRLAKVAEEVEAYGNLLSPLSFIPFVGSWIDRFRNVGSVVKKFQEHKRESVTARRVIKRLFTFPDDFTLVGSRSSMQAQLGNAVPPLLARQVIEQFTTS